MIKNIIKYYFILLIFLLFGGCKTITDIFENVAFNFREPGKVNKIFHPIRKDVRLSALWTGHVTVLLQMDDKVIITDPFLTGNIALLQKRLVEAGIEIDSLEKIDLILLSHSHFDHTNLGSLALLEERFPDAKLIFPVGLEEFLPNLSFDFIPLKKADEKNKVYFGEEKNIDGVKITAVAAFHWGGRYGLDGLIWGYDTYTGYIIEYNGMTVYFAGDTAYDTEFYKLLGTKYNIDLAIIPIGPCLHCYYIDKPFRHLYPSGVIKILKETSIQMMIPVHYGTILEKSEPEKPKDILIKLLDNEPQLKDRVKILKIGEQLILKYK
jgi:L-ascorbate metabolism protein UlaG (beta-lactamase superfamily)